VEQLKSIAIIFLFLVPAIAGCLGDKELVSLSAEDVIVSPETMIAGEFQPLVITAKKDMSVFIPNLVIDPLSNYVQNGTVLDMRIGETRQLISMAPPRIDSTFIFLADYGTQNWPIRNSNESWENWVNRNGIVDEGLVVERVMPSEGTSLDTLNLTKDKSGNTIPVKIDVKRQISAAYSIDEGGLFSTGFVDGRTVYNNIYRITDDTPDLLDPADGAVGYLDRWAGQGNLAYEDAAQFLIAEMNAYGLRVETQRFDLTDVLDNQNPEAYNICGFRDGTLYPDEWLVFGAHFDIAPPANAVMVDPHVSGERTYGTRYGAYDNTAGTSMVLATAEAMADMPYDTRRSMVFCLWSGEEGGKRGSDYWTETLEDEHPDVTVTNYINLDMAGVNWPGGGGAPCGDEHGGSGGCDPDPQPDDDGYPKDSEVWPMRIYIGPSLNYNKIDQPDMVYLSQWIGSDAMNVSMQQDILVGSDNNSDTTWKYDVWVERDRPEIIIYEDTTARSDHASFQDNLGTITLGYGGLVDGYWCYHQTCDTLEEMEDWMETGSKDYGNNATGKNNLVNSLDLITWWATYSFFHMDERPILNAFLN
tara:strand:- start:462 stop:2222 length:1761 start_codon:yes stop_codon:yes gene_type:complete